MEYFVQFRKVCFNATLGENSVLSTKWEEKTYGEKDFLGACEVGSHLCRDICTYGTKEIYEEGIVCKEYKSITMHERNQNGTD